MTKDMLPTFKRHILMGIDGREGNFLLGISLLEGYSYPSGWPHTCVSMSSIY